MYAASNCPSNDQYFYCEETHEGWYTSTYYEFYGDEFPEWDFEQAHFVKADDPNPNDNYADIEVTNTKHTSGYYYPSDRAVYFWNLYIWDSDNYTPTLYTHWKCNNIVTNPPTQVITKTNNYLAEDVELGAGWVWVNQEVITYFQEGCYQIPGCGPYGCSLMWPTDYVHEEGIY